MTNSVPLRRALQRYSGGGVATDSLALILTSGLTAATGFLFWTLAARMLTPQELGIETALLSLVTTAGTIAANGTGNSFTALLPVPGCAHRDRLRDGYLLVVTTSVVLGVVAGLIASHTMHLSAVMTTSWAIVGSVTMAFFALKDSAMIGLGAAAKLPVQNFIVSIAKIALFPIGVVLVAHPAVTATLVTAGVAAVLVITVIVPRLIARGANVRADDARPAPTRRDLSIFTMRDGVASAMSFGVILSLPFITTAVAGPVEGAVLALALTIAQALDLVAAGVGTALTTGLAASPEGMWARARRAWGITFAAVIATGIVILAISPMIMAMLGPSYREQPVVLVVVILMLGAALRVSFVVWSAVLRALSQTATLLKVNGFTVPLVLSLILLSTSHWGAVGSAIGLSAGSVILGSIGAIALIRSRGGA